MGYDYQVPFLMALGLVRSAPEPSVYLVLFFRGFHREGAVCSHVLYSWHTNAISSVEGDEQLHLGFIVAVGTVRKVTFGDLQKEKKDTPQYIQRLV